MEHPKLEGFSFEVGPINDGRFIAVSECEPFFCFVREDEDEVVRLAREAVAAYRAYIKAGPQETVVQQRDVSLINFRGKKVLLDNEIAA